MSDPRDPDPDSIPGAARDSTGQDAPDATGGPAGVRAFEPDPGRDRAPLLVRGLSYLLARAPVLVRGWSYLRARARLGAFVLLVPAIVLGGMLFAVQPALLTVPALLVEYMLVPAGVLLAAAVLALLLAPWRVARTLTVFAAVGSAAVAASALVAYGYPADKAGVTVAVMTLVASVILLAFAGRGYLGAFGLKSSHVAVLGSVLVALLPLVQFWHVASFVPSQQETTLGATVTTDVEPDDRGARGTVTVKIANAGDAGAYVLASEMITCQRAAPQPAEPLEELYEDPECVTTQLFENLTELDHSSEFELTSIFRDPEEPPAAPRVIEVTVLLWTVRQDRVELGPELEADDLEPVDDECLSATDPDPDHKLTGYEVLPNSRPEGVAQDPLRLVFLRLGDEGDAYVALQPVDEPVCTTATTGTTPPGVPVGSAELQANFGLKNLRLNYETWIGDPQPSG
jgi:hypothetical protein